MLALKEKFEFGRSHDVDEEGRHHFPFALWNGLRFDGDPESEGQIRGLWPVSVVGGRYLRPRLLVKGRATCVAEFCARAIGCAACRASQLQRYSARIAELSAFQILTIAAWAPHSSQGSMQ
jgi:hypothetical protein